MPTKATTKKPARKAAPKACKPKPLTKAEAAAWWAAQDEQTKDLVRSIQKLKRIF